MIHAIICNMEKGVKYEVRERDRKENAFLLKVYRTNLLEKLDEALKAVHRMGFSPIRIHPLPEAKHIFSHVEWQMQGYLVLVEDADAREVHTPLGNAQELLFVEPSRTERDYPIPAAFAAYVTSLNILLGQEKFERR